MPNPLETDYLLKHLIQPVNLFDNLDAFDGMVERCKRQGYEVYEFDCRKFQSQDEIYNAILHRIGALQPELYYQDITHFLFRHHYSHSSSKSEKKLMAFRYFDTFYRLDPECAQALMDGLGQAFYRYLSWQKRYTVCAHSEDRQLKLSPVLVVEAGWVWVKNFGEEVDARKAREKAAHSWLTSMADRLQAAGFKVRNATTVSILLQSYLGFADEIEIHEAAPPFEEIVRVHKLNETARAWWDEVVAKFLAQHPTDHHFGHPSDGLRDRFGVQNLNELREMNLPLEEIFLFLTEYEAQQLENRKNDPRLLDYGWRARVLELFNAKSQIQKPPSFIVRGLDLLQGVGAARLSRLNSTPEAAAELLLQLDPQLIDIVDKAPKLVNMDDVSLD